MFDIDTIIFHWLLS